MSTIVTQRDGQLPELKVDKRTLDKTSNPPNVKHLRYSRKLPLECDKCPYRPKEEMGNGICTVYKKGELCLIRRDIRKAIDKYGTRNPHEVLPLMEEELEATYEKLKFFEALENMSGSLDPEVTKRINALNNLAKVVHEFKTIKQTIEVEEKHTLSNDKKSEIAREMTRILRVTNQVPTVENL